MEWEKEKKLTMYQHLGYEQEKSMEDFTKEMAEATNLDMDQAAQGRIEQHHPLNYAMLPLHEGMNDAATAAGDAAASKTQPQGTPLLPCVQRNAAPSAIIGKYMDGLARRMNKMSAACFSI